jgi:hypothetical protein
MVYFGSVGSHLLSLGLPDTVDYFVTGDATTPPALQHTVAEQLVRLGDVGMFHYRPARFSEKEVLQVQG